MPIIRQQKLYKEFMVLRSDKTTGPHKISTRLVKSTASAFRVFLTVPRINNVQFNLHSLV